MFESEAAKNAYLAKISAIEAEDTFEGIIGEIVAFLVHSAVWKEAMAGDLDERLSIVSELEDLPEGTLQLTTNRFGDFPPDILEDGADSLLQRQLAWCFGLAACRAGTNYRLRGFLIAEAMTTSSTEAGYALKAARQAFFNRNNPNEIEPLLADIRQAVQSNAHRFTMLGEEEALTQAVADWRSRPSFEDLWYRSTFERFSSFDRCAALVAAYVGASPEPALALIDEINHPSFALEVFQQVTAGQTTGQLITLLKMAPVCFEKDGKGQWTFNGRPSAPYLLLKLTGRHLGLFQQVSSPEPPAEDRTQLCETLASRPDGLALGLHFAAWLLWRHWAKGSISGLANNQFEQMFTTLCDALAASSHDIIKAADFDPVLQIVTDKSLQEYLETGKGEPATPGPNSTKDLAAAVAMVFLSQADQQKATAPQVQSAQEECAALYRNLLIRQRIDLRGTEAHETFPLNHRILAEVFGRLPDPCGFWRDIWIDIAEQRRRAAFRILDDGSCLMDASLLHLAIGSALIATRPLPHDQALSWIAPFWGDLLRENIFLPVPLHHIQANTERNITLLFGLAARFAEKGAADTWNATIAEGLDCLGGDHHLIARCLRSIEANSGDLPTISTYFNGLSQKPLKAIFREWIACLRLNAEKQGHRPFGSSNDFAHILNKL